MKSLNIILSFYFCTILIAQDKRINQQVHDLSEQVLRAEGGAKLQLLDSLSIISENNTEFKYDSIVRETIKFAFELDSVNMASRYTSKLIFYLCNRSGKAQEALELFEEFLDKEVPLTKDGIWADLYLNGADSYFFSKREEQSLGLYQKAQEYAIKAGDTTLYGLAKSYQASAYSMVGRFADASQQLQEAIEIFDLKHDSVNILKTRTSLANLYSQNGFYNEAGAERDIVIATAKRNKNYGVVVPNLFNAALDNLTLGDQAERIANLKEALKYSEKADELKVYYEPRILNNLLIAYSQVDSLKKAEEVYSRIQRDKQRYSIGMYELSYNEAMYSYRYARGNYQEALSLAERHFKILDASTSYEELQDTHEFLFKVYEAMGNRKKAFEHYKAYTHIKDSIGNVQKVQALTYYQTLYETEKRDAQIEAQEAKISILNVKNKVKMQWILFGSLGAVLLIIFLYVRYRQRIKYETLENQMLNIEIEHKKKDLGNLALNISQNQKWAKELMEKLEQMKATHGETWTEELQSLETEINNRIWVGEGTEELHQKIDLLSSSFFEKLNISFSDLTKTEIRLCSLIRMEMSTKEVAILQNINPDSVKKSRNRLRKKLNLSPHEDLYAFLKSF